MKYFSKSKTLRYRYFSTCCFMDFVISVYIGLLDIMTFLLSILLDIIIIWTSLNSIFWLLDIFLKYFSSMMELIIFNLISPTAWTKNWISSRMIYLTATSILQNDYMKKFNFNRLWNFTNFTLSHKYSRRVYTYRYMNNVYLFVPTIIQTHRNELVHLSTHLLHGFMCSLLFFF